MSRNLWPVRVVQDGVVRSRIAAALILSLLCAVVTLGSFVLDTPQRAAACSCVELTDAEAYEFADVVFTGALVEINTPDGDIVVSNDPERFVFDVDQVFKGEAQARQSVVTAREGASCGLEIGSPGPFVVFARLEDDSLTSGAVEGEVYSSLCSGTRPLVAGALPASFGTPSAPVAVPTVAEPSATPSSNPNEGSDDGLWITATFGVLVLLVGTGVTVALHRRRHDRAMSGRAAQ